MFDTYESKFGTACFIGAALVGIFLWQLHENADDVFTWMRKGENSLFWIAGLYVGGLLLGGVWLAAKYKINVVPALTRDL